MKTITCVEPGKFEFVDRDFPSLRKGHALVKIKRIGVCGTDLHAYEGTQPYFTYPRVLGHELGCEYVAGDAPGFRTGENITIIPYDHCGQCLPCRKGNTNCCQQLKVLGVHTDGGMVEYLSVPSHLLVHGQGLPLDTLALIEPFCIAAHGVRRANVGPDDHVLIVGAGPIGLATMEFCLVAGAKVISLDVNENRLAFSKGLGVSFALHAQEDNVQELVREITSGDMASVVIDATGNIGAINNAFSYLAHSGRYVLIGLQKNTITVNHPEFHKREATLMSSRNATRTDFEFVLQTVNKGLIDPTQFITRRIPFDAVAEDFHLISAQPDMIKAMIEI
ncbi:zinc-binding alcohol dehydrogenase family protein [Chryseolinea lacunae]|uniref:Zinc-binding alcohol dehydrogenase family protein n=1 Tax=Chryseolinea lacunae TaxID=2801331 RepID=A0ABS1L224_9BACT|nr:zinc-binding alcohol dehydrogenase family protein [Chryseolinea lacunae]MBL0745771.1 zinc-binding alcohol dehydrogenase family protein [Chryseolinea lacunae]